MDIGVLTRHHVLFVLIGGVHIFPLLPLHRCINCVIFLQDYIFLKIRVVSLKAGSLARIAPTLTTSAMGVSSLETNKQIQNSRWCQLDVCGIQLLP